MKSVEILAETESNERSLFGAKAIPKSQEPENSGASPHGMNRESNDFMRDPCCFRDIELLTGEVHGEDGQD